ncbi:hypothetical protein Bca101_061452 [Brassica carinata]
MSVLVQRCSPLSGWNLALGLAAEEAGLSLLPHFCRRNRSGYFGWFLVAVPWLIKAMGVCWCSNRSERFSSPFAIRVGVDDFFLLLISRSFGCSFHAFLSFSSIVSP